MFALIAILTVLSTGDRINIKVLAPFPTEQLCHARSPNLITFIRNGLPQRGLTEDQVSIETKCVPYE